MRGYSGWSLGDHPEQPRRRRDAITRAAGQCRRAFERLLNEVRVVGDIHSEIPNFAYLLSPVRRGDS